jgi:hypothetical protein
MADSPTSMATSSLNSMTNFKDWDATIQSLVNTLIMLNDKTKCQALKGVRILDAIAHHHYVHWERDVMSCSAARRGRQMGNTHKIIV